jgi:hypothetical protein
MKRVRYTEAEFQAAYQAWCDLFDSISGSHARMDARIAAWDHYCDVRDSLPLGTSRTRRLVRDARDSYERVDSVEKKE